MSHRQNRSKTFNWEAWGRSPVRHNGIVAERRVYRDLRRRYLAVERAIFALRIAQLNGVK
jgi:hypothetical protein